MNCLVPNCTKKLYRRQYCISHYRRLQRHGDPLGGEARPDRSTPIVEKACSTCQKTKPVEDFSPTGKGCDRHGHLYRSSSCKPCRAKARRGTDNRLARRRRTLAKYGLTEQAYAALLERQAGVCAICHEAGKLVVDHDHTTGEVRGLLCNGCNTAIGMLKENPDLFMSSVRYLQAPPAKEK